MAILINSGHKAAKHIKILLLTLCFSISFIYCESSQQPTIKILGQVYLSLPQISDEDYSVVPSIMVSAQPTPVNQIQPNLVHPTPNVPLGHRFDAKQKSDYFVIQASDTAHLDTRYNFIKGKNIFTPAYINSQVLESIEEVNKSSKNQSVLSSTLREEFNKNFEQIKKLENEKSQNNAKTTEDKKVNPNVSESSTDEKEQQAIQEKSSQIYHEFKSIEALKEKNLRENKKGSADEQKYENLQKLVGYIVIGLIISFAIIKSASKAPEAPLPKTSQQRTELRLKDTADDDDDEQVESSESDQ